MIATSLSIGDMCLVVFLHPTNAICTQYVANTSRHHKTSPNFYVLNYIWYIRAKYWKMYLGFSLNMIWMQLLNKDRVCYLGHFLWYWVLGENGVDVVSVSHGRHNFHVHHIKNNRLIINLCVQLFNVNVGCIFPVSGLCVWAWWSKKLVFVLPPMNSSFRGQVVSIRL